VAVAQEGNDQEFPGSLLGLQCATIEAMSVSFAGLPTETKRPARVIFLAVLWTVSTFASFGQIIPANRLVAWTPRVTVGVPGGIPTYRTNLIDVTKAPYNANRTGTADASAAVQAAINAAGSNSVIYLPAGTYRMDSTLYLGCNRSGITLRGAGAGTILDSRAPSIGISVGCASDYNWSWPASGNVITGGQTKGSTTITIADTSAFSVGRMVHIAFANNPGQTDDPVTVHVSGYGDLRRQMSRVTAKTATTLSISPALYSDYNGARGIVHVAQLQTEMVGIEDLVLNMANSPATFGIELEQCYACWIKNVKVSLAANYHVFLYDSLNCEVRDCFLDRLNHTGSNGAGLLCNTTSGSLVENNIIYKAFPLMEINHGSSGNVFAYNFCHDSSVYGGEGAAIDSNHGPHNSYNLYEGNIAPNLQSDGYFGSASHDTVYRNWFHGTEPGIAGVGWCISLNRFTRSYSLVGNIFGTNVAMGDSALSFGNPNMGNGGYSGAAPPWANWGTSPGPSGFQERDTGVTNTLIMKGNYNYYSRSIPAAEALGTNTLAPSLYLASKPAWFGNLTWPPFDPLSPNPRFESIPAGYRFVYGTEPPGSGGNKPAFTSSVFAGPSASQMLKVTPTSGRAPLTVTVYNQTSWSGILDFGDGGTASGTSAVYTYTSAGLYTVSLKQGTNTILSYTNLVAVTNAP
jgi:hypothetical protein